MCDHFFFCCVAFASLHSYSRPTSCNQMSSSSSSSSSSSAPTDATRPSVQPTNTGSNDQEEHPSQASIVSKHIPNLSANGIREQVCGKYFSKIAMKLWDPATDIKLQNFRVAGSRETFPRINRRVVFNRDRQFSQEDWSRTTLCWNVLNTNTDYELYLVFGGHVWNRYSNIEHYYRWRTAMKKTQLAMRKTGDPLKQFIHNTVKKSKVHVMGPRWNPKNSRNIAVRRFFFKPMILHLMVPETIITKSEETQVVKGKKQKIVREVDTRWTDATQTERNVWMIDQMCQFIDEQDEKTFDAKNEIFGVLWAGLMEGYAVENRNWHIYKPFVDEDNNFGFRICNFRPNENISTMRIVFKSTESETTAISRKKNPQKVNARKKKQHRAMHPQEKVFIRSSVGPITPIRTAFQMNATTARKNNNAVGKNTRRMSKQPKEELPKTKETRIPRMRTDPSIPISTVEDFAAFTANPMAEYYQHFRPPQLFYPPFTSNYPSQTAAHA